MLSDPRVVNCASIADISVCNSSPHCIGSIIIGCKPLKLEYK